MSKDIYVKWLCSIIGGAEGYLFLCMTLFDIEFFAIHDFDVSRIGDALELRNEFIEKVEKDVLRGYDKIVSELESYPPSVLEVLVSLALKIENDIIYDPSEEDLSYAWFWYFIENLDLIDICDSAWSSKAEEYIRNKVNNFLNRDYEADGSDGNIYILRIKEDIRNLSLWEQTWRFVTEWMEDRDRLPF